MAALLRKQKKLEKMAEYERQQQLLKEKMYFLYCKRVIRIVRRKKRKKKKKKSQRAVFMKIHWCLILRY